MNRFSSLDNLFPTLPNRSGGEVVSVNVSFNLFGFKSFITLDPICWKRKAWYVNASVNAFHLHRGLCREFRDQLKLSFGLSERQIRSVTRTLGDIVAHAYVTNWLHDVQHQEFEIDVYAGYSDAGAFFFKEENSLRFNVDAAQCDKIILDHIIAKS